MNSIQHTHRHWWQAKEVVKELPLALGATVIAALAQWLAWCIK